MLATEFNIKHLKKAEEHIGRNLMSIIIKMKTGKKMLIRLPQVYVD